MKRTAPYLLGAFFAVLLGSVFVTGASSDIYLHKGLDAYKHGDYPKAEANLSRAEGLDGHNASAPYYLGLCLHHDSHNEAALREFRTVCSTVEDKKYASPSDRQLEQEAKAQIQQLDTKP